MPKPSGGERIVSTFQIADEVVSNYLLRSLTRKNLPKLSSRSYAYRPDLGPHDAISYLRSEFAREHRLFVAEYDFRKFFDTVEHEHLRKSLDRMGIIKTPLEEYTIDMFLKAPEPYLSNIDKKLEKPPRYRGIPQGTSLSLFLANIAASELDRSLERLGVGFVRYADDTLIWSADYGKICAASAALYEASEQIGSPVNSEKSNGIRLLIGEEEPKTEMKSTTSVIFLGHDIGLRSVRIKIESINRIKAKIKNLIYANLLLEPAAGTQVHARLKDKDRDYIVLIWQLRRYLYGSLTERQVRDFHKGAIPPMSFEGVMSFYPLVDDYASLRELDSWIATRIWLAMRKRAQLLSTSSIAPTPPHGLTRSELINFKVKSTRTGDLIDLRIPSLYKIASVLRRAVSTHGLGVVSGRTPLYHYD
ncbi:reverse transcriptase domain-containing protein [Rhodococcus qingshengii]|uniref:reverse transcriptase domain-containing protein n=1 Tax=Rhodococcus qingshengii TaxID=334542 RepID=UPI0035F85EDB